jgi:hypothetical protein
MNRAQKIAIFALGLGGVVGFGGLAAAGTRSSVPLVVNLTSRNAIGALGEARSAPGAIGSLGCTLRGTTTGISGSCAAQEASGAYIGCTTTDQHKIYVIGGLRSDGYLYFEVNPDGTCGFMRTSSHSAFAPKVQ